MTRTSHPPDDLSEVGAPADAEALYRATVLRMLEAHGYRAVAMARLYGTGLSFAPGLRWMRFVAGAARESVEHGAAIAGCYQALGATHFDAVLERRLRAQPPRVAASRAELAVACLVAGHGWRWTLRDHDQCSYLPYRAVVAQLGLALEARQVVAERFLAELVQAEGGEAALPFVAPWRDAVRASFGRAGTPGAAYAVSVGLKKRDVAATADACDEDIVRALRACGLNAGDGAVGTESAEATGDENDPAPTQSPTAPPRAGGEE